MADTVFKADFRGSCALETPGLKEEDSSVEICMDITLTGEARHRYMHTNRHKHIDRPSTCTRTNRTAQVKAQTTETQKTDVNGKVLFSIFLKFKITYHTKTQKLHLCLYLLLHVLLMLFLI